MPIKYVPFIPEPVEGQAVLGNFNRILKYRGADDVSMVLQRGMPLYEMEKLETVGNNVAPLSAWHVTNLVVCHRINRYTDTKE